MDNSLDNTKNVGITSFGLKIVAIVAMTCNHVANVFAAYLPPTVGLVLYGVGGATFPIMAFLLVEGFLHTSDIRKYAARLAVFAAVSQVPYSLLWGATPNVLWTLLLGLGVLYAKTRLESRGVFMAVLLAAAVASASFDWGLIGVVLVYLFYLIRERHVGEAFQTERRGIWLALLLPAAVLIIGALTFLSMGDLGGNLHILANALMNFEPVTGLESRHITNTLVDAGLFIAGVGELTYALVGFSIAGILLPLYNGRRGRPMKWLFYAYYPAHLAVIWAILQIVSR